MDDTRVHPIGGRRIDSSSIIIIVVVVIVIDMLHDIGSLATHLLRCLTHTEHRSMSLMNETRPEEIIDKRQPMEETDVDIVWSALRSAPAAVFQRSSVLLQPYPLHPHPPSHLPSALGFPTQLLNCSTEEAALFFFAGRVT